MKIDGIAFHADAMELHAYSVTLEFPLSPHARNRPNTRKCVLECLYLSSFKLADSRPFDFNELIVSFRFENVACAYTIRKWKFNK